MLKKQQNDHAKNHIYFIANFQKGTDSHPFSSQNYPSLNAPLIVPVWLLNNVLLNNTRDKYLPCTRALSHNRSEFIFTAFSPTSNILKDYFINEIMCVCMRVCFEVSGHKCSCLRYEKGVRFLGPWVTRINEPIDVDAVNWTYLFNKNSAYS